MQATAKKEKKRVGILVSAETAKRVKVYAAAHNKTASEVWEEAVLNFLANANKKKA